MQRHRMNEATSFKRSFLALPFCFHTQVEALSAAKSTLLPAYFQEQDFFLPFVFGLTFKAFSELAQFSGQSNVPQQG